MPIDLESEKKHTETKGGYAELTVEQIKNMNQKALESRMAYDDDKPLGMMLDKYPGFRLGFDIGSGTGWASEYMYKHIDIVYAIEPSKEAFDKFSQICKEKGYTNLVPQNMFAEDFLAGIECIEPAFFNSLVVLSHLNDAAVSAICSQIERFPRESGICFSELWGEEYHAPQWHCRTKEWWQKNLPSFDITFVERQCQQPGRYKSFYGIKKK